MARPRGVARTARCTWPIDARRERLLVEAHEQLGERRAEARLDALLDLVERDRRDVVLELLQLGDDVGREDVGARRRDLPELDEGRPEVLRDEAHALGARDASCSLSRRHRVLVAFSSSCAAEAGARDDFAEAVANEDGGDLAQPPEIADRGEDRDTTAYCQGTVDVALPREPGFAVALPLHWQRLGRRRLRRCTSFAYVQILAGASCTRCRRPVVVSVGAWVGRAASNAVDEQSPVDVRLCRPERRCRSLRDLHANLYVSPTGGRTCRSPAA